VNPFANVAEFESLRAAAFDGADRFAAHVRRLTFTAEDELLEAVVSERVQRMIETAIGTAKAVMLVGPPGTGKTHTLRKVLQQVQADPARVGLSTAPGVRWATPEEEWTFDRVVLGQTVVDGEIVSEEGVLLSALRNDEWLILDETNRADMDRVLGGVLTWLSGQRVQIGNWRSAQHPGASTPVYLSWGDDESTEIVEDIPNLVEYRVGTSWRLLGTYNAVDAQRVFRMGQALTRRFKHVPILPVPPTEFAAILAVHNPDGPNAAEIAACVEALYRAHLTAPGAALGPALFTDIPGYLHRAMQQHPDALFDELVAEAYVTSVGALVARLDDVTLEDLRIAMADQSALDGDAWRWVLSQLQALGA